MCLAVYLGSPVALDAAQSLEGALGIEVATWRPPSLDQYPHIYFLGRQGKTSVECSCLLSEQVIWGEHEIAYVADEHLVAAPRDPFADLRKLCHTVFDACAAKGLPAQLGIYCDDSGGEATEVDDLEIDDRIATPTAFARGSYAFSDQAGNWALRRFTVIPLEV